VPFRASIGFNNTQGLVKNNDYSRISAGFKVTPSFFNKHLKVDVNAKNKGRIKFLVMLALI
jgi:iron complex outermembrane receptor protein